MERCASPAHELGIEDEKGKPAEVIAMEVGEKDAVDRVGINFEAAQGYHRRGAAVDEESSSGVADEDAALEPPATAESIAAAEKLNVNR